MSPFLAAFENMPHMAMLCIVTHIETMMAMMMARLKRMWVTIEMAAGLLKTGYGISPSGTSGICTSGLVSASGTTSVYDVMKPPIAMMNPPRVMTSDERTTGHGKGGTKPPNSGILAYDMIAASSSLEAMMT